MTFKSVVKSMWKFFWGVGYRGLCEAPPVDCPSRPPPLPMPGPTDVWEVEGAIQWPVMAGITAAQAQGAWMSTFPINLWNITVH